MKVPHDPHVILGVAKDASPAELLRAFRRAVQTHHPDKNPGDPRAAERLRLVLGAWQKLRDPAPKRGAKPESARAEGAAGPASSGPPVAIPCQLRGADILGELAVDAALAAQGWVLAELSALDACPACLGKGFEEIAGRWGRTERWACESCRGDALLSVKRTVKLRLPSRGAGPAVVRLRGVGLPRLPTGPAGRAKRSSSAAPDVTRGDALITLRWR